MLRFQMHAQQTTAHKLQVGKKTFNKNYYTIEGFRAGNFYCIFSRILQQKGQL